MAYALADEYLWKEVKDRVVVLHFDSGKYYSLNTTGSLIWRGLLDNLSQAEIVDQICLTFDIERQAAEKDTVQMISEFVEKKFIKQI